MSDQPKRAPIKMDTQFPGYLEFREVMKWDKKKVQAVKEEIRLKEAVSLLSFIQSDTLPTSAQTYDPRDHPHAVDCKAVLEAAGVKFLELVPDDPLFQFVELPIGWKRVITDHSYFNLVDAEGRYRASIYYVALFYNRMAYLCIDPAESNFRPYPFLPTE